MFTQDYLLQSLLVKGEVSNLKYHTSGHIYFTLKDPKGTINCVMFAGNRKGLSFRMCEGMQVIVTGTVDVYERDGKYQLYAKEIMQDGTGYLYEAYEKLKKELEELGMFAQEYKKPIPAYIKTLGVVTASTGAAVRDIIQIASRRNPYVQIILYPAIVQGDGAVSSIVNGIHALEQLGVDVMIVGRGGGSIEDLWAFNEREVAQAVFDCSIPIISAVGHETDTTIIDYVSDLRAPTPSAAAELAVRDINELFRVFDDYEKQLNMGFQRCVDLKRMQLNQYRQRLTLSSPAARIREQRKESERLTERLHTLMEHKMTVYRHRLDMYIERMNGLSPLDRLKSGFSYVEDEKGRNVSSVTMLNEGQNINIRFKDGQATAMVTHIQEGKL